MKALHAQAAINFSTARSKDLDTEVQDLFAIFVGIMLEIAQLAIILAKMLTVTVISIAASAVTKVFRMRKLTLVICFSMTKEKM